MQRRTILGGALALFLMNLGYSQEEDRRTQDQDRLQQSQVKITDRGFEPQRLEVTVGQKVTWQNMTQRDHTVTAKPLGQPARPQEQDPEKRDQEILFDSGPIKPGASWEHTFTKEGTYEYGCKLEPTMTGTIVVKAAGQEKDLEKDKKMDEEKGSPEDRQP